MGFRFRKSIKVAPGIRLNLGTRGVSVTAGVRGASVNFGTRGTYANVGLPGSGISYRARLDSGSQVSKSQLVRQQRFEREHLKLEHERKRQEALSKVKLSLDKDTGAVTIENAHGEELSRQDLKLVWEQKEQAIINWLEREAEGITGDIELLSNIHHDTPPPHTEPEYEVAAYPKFSAAHPMPPQTPQPPEITVLPSLNAFLRLFRSKRERHEKNQKDLNAQHASDLNKWQQAKRIAEEKYQTQVETYEKALAQWRVSEIEHQKVQQSYKAAFPTLIRTDIATMEQLLEEELISLIWPRETLVSYQITSGGAEVWLDVDLPEIEDLPQKIATLHSSGKKLAIKEKPRKQLQLEYARHVFGIAFRLAGMTLATLPAASRVIISGFSQRLSPATGSMSDEYLYSIDIDRTKFSGIDFNALDRVDPVEAMRSFNCTAKLLATGIFRSIEPLVPG